MKAEQESSMSIWEQKFSDALKNMEDGVESQMNAMDSNMTQFEEKVKTTFINNFQRMEENFKSTMESKFKDLEEDLKAKTNEMKKMTCELDKMKDKTVTLDRLNSKRYIVFSGKCFCTKHGRSILNFFFFKVVEFLNQLTMKTCSRSWEW